MSQERRTPNYLTFIALFALGLTGTLNYQNHKSDLARRLCEEAAGEDRIMQENEKIDLLKGLGLEAKVSGEEDILIEPSADKNKLDIYLVQRDSINQNYRKIGEADIYLARRYLENIK